MLDGFVFPRFHKSGWLSEIILNGRVCTENVGCDEGSANDNPTSAFDC